MNIFRALWLFSLCQSLRFSEATAPGDEDEECAEPDYPAGIAVLMDSWRYRSLLGPPPPSLADPSAVWTTDTTERDNSGLWYGAGGTCEVGGVQVCLSQMRTTSWVFTQYISKPASVNYPVRVSVQISYTLTQCEHSDCRSFELLSYVTNSPDPRERSDEGNYNHNRIKPESEIPRDDSTNYNSTTTLYLDLNGAERGFYLSIESDERMCVTIRRLLVFMNICPSTENGLVDYPSTPSPLTGSVSAVGECSPNAHHTQQSQPGSLRCDSQGEWANDQTDCECDEGYYRDNNNCRAYLVPVQNPYTVREEQSHVQICFELAPGLPLSLQLTVSTIDNTAIGRFDYQPVSMSIRRSQFTTGSAPVIGCVDVPIVDDDLSEREESFVVQVNNESLILTQVSVNIESSDGESACTEGRVTVVRDADNGSLQLVEMCQSQGVWSPLCDDEWTLQDAAVVCREAAEGMSFEAYQIIEASHQSFSAYECLGSEAYISQCSRSSQLNTLCYHILVECSDTLSPPTLLPPPTPPTPATTTEGEHSTSETAKEPASHSSVKNVAPSVGANRPGDSPSSSRNSSQTNRIIAGVAVSFLIIIVLVVAVMVVGVAIYLRRRKSITYNMQQQTKDSRELENPLYDGTQCIMINTPAQPPSRPHPPPTDPIYERADGPTPAPPTNDLFDDPVYAGGSTLLPQSAGEINRNHDSPEYEAVHHTGPTPGSTLQSRVDVVSTLQQEGSNGSVQMETNLNRTEQEILS